MQVGMMQKSLTPGVKHGQEADLGAEMFWVSGNAVQCLAGCAEQDVVDDSFVLQREMSKLIWHGEHNVKVVNREKLGCLFLKPARFGQRLTFGAMTIATRVVRNPCVATARALIAVPAQLSGATLLDGSHDAALL
jgi:hypothetical protein